ncbi:hypothetical protein COOONC_25214, partial [Cooperia oncophora]
MQIPFVGFQPVRTSEHMPAFGVFGLLQIVAAMQYARQRVSRQQFMTLFVGGLTAVGCLAFVVYFALVWGDSYPNHCVSLGTSTHNLGIIFSFDLHITAAVFPVGVWYCVKNVNDERVFIILYAVSAVYFAGVMVRLMLTLTPAVCVLSGIAFSYTFEKYLRDDEKSSAKSDSDRQMYDKVTKKGKVQQDVHVVGVSVVVCIVIVQHGVLSMFLCVIFGNIR